MPLELEDGDLPLNTFSPKKPFKGKVVSVEKITGPKATGETCNIVIDTNGDIPYWEGQSYGVVPPVRPRERSTSYSCIMQKSKGRGSAHLQDWLTHCSC